MVYSNSKRAASIASITNQNQGGGPKKAGFPYQVGRDSWTSLAFGTTGFINRTSSNGVNKDGTARCCSRAQIATLNPWQRKVSISRNIGGNQAGNNYFRFIGPR
jgi:hypothetical protein